MEQDNCVFISSSYTALVSNLKNKTQNPDFYSELAILYTLMNGCTYFKEISRLRYGEVIELNDEFKTIQIHRFYDYLRTFQNHLNQA